MFLLVPAHLGVVLMKGPLTGCCSCLSWETVWVIWSNLWSNFWRADCI